MHVGSLLLEFALVSPLLLLLLQLVVPIMLELWCWGRLYVFSYKRSSVLDSKRKESASVSITRR